MSDWENESVLQDVTKFNTEIKKQTRISHFKVGILSFCATAILLANIIYLASPLSKAKINNLTGNYDLNSQDVLKIAGIENSSLLSVDVEQVISNLNSSSYIATSSCSWHMTYLDIYIDEIVPIAKNDDSILLTNGKNYASYQLHNPDYKPDLNRHLPEYLSYVSSSDAHLFLNNLKYLNSELFNDVVYLDETIIKDDLGSNKYFGVYFQKEENVLRIRIEKGIIKEALKNTSKLNDAIKRMEMFAKNEDVSKKYNYDAQYVCQSTCRIISHETEAK